MEAVLRFRSDALPGVELLVPRLAGCLSTRCW